MKYRSEIFYGEGYRSSAEVMAHEVFEYGNTDILQTLASTILKNSPMREKLEIIEEELNNDYVADGDDGSIYEMIVGYEDDETEGINFFKEVLSEIEKVTGKNVQYCLWLCDTKEDVYGYDLYGDLTDKDIDAYEETDIVLSDLGQSGKLYGYESYPEPVEEIEIDR